MTAPDKLSTELHRAYERAKAARLEVVAELEAARSALDLHDQAPPVAFDQVAADAAIAKAAFTDRVNGSNTAGELARKAQFDRAESDAARAAHEAKRVELEHGVTRHQAALAAAEATIADLLQSRKAVVAKAAQESLDAELAAHRDRIESVISGATKIVALRAIVREVARPASEARRFDAVTIELPALGATSEHDASTLAAGAQYVGTEHGGSVRLTAAALATNASRAFVSITDSLCSVQSP